MGKPRESCRYRAADIREQWIAGWDERDEKIAADKRREAIPRWETQRRGYQSDAPIVESRLRGHAPAITVHRQSYSPGVWFVSAHQWGIQDRRLGTDEELPDIGDVQREAIRVVRHILADRMMSLDRVADEDGALKGPASEAAGG